VALHSWNFGLAVSYLEGEPESESQPSSKIQKLLRSSCGVS